MTDATTVSFGSTISLAEAANLVIHCPDNHFLFRGPPGIGKSSLMGTFKEHFGDAYNYVYFDCINKDLGDITMPSVNHELKVTEYYPNQVFQMQNGKPCIIMLDEFTKAMQPIQNMLHPLLEAHNPRLGDMPLPKGSRVLITGNMASDGVGDNIKAHTLNRVSVVTVAPPTADEWLLWAARNDIDPVVMAWVHRFPHCLDSYVTSDITSNPYVFNPKVPQTGGFVSPRSLEKVSGITRNRGKLSSNALLAAVIGTIGASAAKDMEAFIAYQDELPDWDDVIASPKTAKLPSSPGACAVMVFGAVSQVDTNSLAPFMEYVERMDAEWQATFCVQIAKNPAKRDVAFKHRKFADWVVANSDIL